MPQIVEGSFISKADGLNISTLTVLPEQKPYKAVIQLVHGMSEYKERYLPFMEYLSQYGYVSVIHDHRGHGKSVKDKKDLGFMYEGGADALLQDIHQNNEIIREEYSQLPLILFGHSMGSLAVRAYTAVYNNTIDMLILCGQPSKNPARMFGTIIAKTEKCLLGPRHKSVILEMLSFGPYVAKFKKDKSCTSWICSDQAVANEYKSSEYCGFVFSDDGYLTLFELLKRAYDRKGWNCAKPDMPVLLVAGAEDPCIGNVRKFASSLKSLRCVGYRDVKGKLYPGMRHEILNEKEKEKVYRDIVTYIKKKGF